MPRVLVAGCGYVGLATAKILHGAGWEVKGWTASPDSAAALAVEPFPIRAVDLTDARAVADARDPVDAIVQCASSRGGGVEDYRRIYLRAAANLRAAFPQTTLLFTSSTSVYAQREGEWVTEESAAEPERETGRVLRETEELILAGGGIVARLAGIYGPSRSALLRKFRGGTAVLDANSDRFVNQVHRDDIATALFLLLQERLQGRLRAEALERRIFNVSDNHPITQRACYEWLAGHLGKPLPPSSATVTQRRRSSSNKRVSSAKLHALGWAPRFPTFPSGMLESVLL